MTCVAIMPRRAAPRAASTPTMRPFRGLEVPSAPEAWSVPESPSAPATPPALVTPPEPDAAPADVPGGAWSTRAVSGRDDKSDMWIPSQPADGDDDVTVYLGPSHTAATRLCSDR